MPQASKVDYLLLDTAGTPCALRRESVREILPIPRLHAPPASGGPLAGFVNFGGSPVPVIDLARLLGLRDRGDISAPDPYSHLVLGAEATFAILVDRVVDFFSVEAESVRPVSDALTLNGCVESEIPIEGRLVHGLATERLLAAEENDRLHLLTRRAAERLAVFDASTD